jgi:hypothetical protein
MKALVAGHAEHAAGLVSALAERGLDAETYVTEGEGDRDAMALADALVALEGRLAGGDAVAVAAGVGDSSIALALTAAKLGVPLASWPQPQNQPQDELAAGERRIIATLASLEAGRAGDEVSPEEAARLIRDWADLGSGR